MPPIELLPKPATELLGKYGERWQANAYPYATTPMLLIARLY
jgi:hypothetical protein